MDLFDSVWATYMVFIIPDEATEMTITLTPENFCPMCGENLSAATGVKEDTTPKTGDISICIYCGEYLVFDEDLRSQSMSQEEFDSLDDEMKFQISMAKFMIMGAIN
jgi:hypothetical protein